MLIDGADTFIKCMVNGSNDWIFPTQRASIVVHQFFGYGYKV